MLGRAIKENYAAPEEPNTPCALRRGQNTSLAPLSPPPGWYPCVSFEASSNNTGGAAAATDGGDEERRVAAPPQGRGGKRDGCRRGHCCVADPRRGSRTWPPTHPARSPSPTLAARHDRRPPVAVVCLPRACRHRASPPSPPPPAPPPATSLASPSSPSPEHARAQTAGREAAQARPQTAAKSGTRLAVRQAEGGGGGGAGAGSSRGGGECLVARVEKLARYFYSPANKIGVASSGSGGTHRLSARSGLHRWTSTDLTRRQGGPARRAECIPDSLATPPVAGPARTDGEVASRTYPSRVPIRAARIGITRRRRRPPMGGPAGHPLQHRGSPLTAQTRSCGWRLGLPENRPTGQLVSRPAGQPPPQPPSTPANTGAALHQHAGMPCRRSVETVASASRTRVEWARSHRVGGGAPAREPPCAAAPATPRGAVAVAAASARLWRRGDGGGGGACGQCGCRCGGVGVGVGVGAWGWPRPGVRVAFVPGWRRR